MMKLQIGNNPKKLNLKVQFFFVLTLYAIFAELTRGSSLPPSNEGGN
jgi:hypothetical protein